MKQVLIVDDDPATRMLLSRVLKPHTDIFSVITAQNGEEAIEIIKNEKIDLVITDIQMPGMDGFDLMADLSTDNPEIPVFVITAFGTHKAEAKIKPLDPTIRYFEKPLNMDVLTASILEELDAGIEGQLHGISLASFLQLIEMEKKTCTITIRSDEKSGTLNFVKGDLIAAEAGLVQNEEAIFELLRWSNIKIEIKNYSKKKKKEVKQPLMNILMEGLKIKDEMESNKKPKTPLKPLKNFSSQKNHRIKKRS